MTKFLDMSFEYDSHRGHVTISIQTLIDTTLRKFNIEKEKSVTTPIGSGVRIEADEEYENIKGPYAELVGVLLFISSIVRPDVLFAVENLARFGEPPKQSHLSTIKRAMRYLKRTKVKEITIKPRKKFHLACYSD